jgi:hypothetical protein
MAAVDLQTLKVAFLRQARLQAVPAAAWLGQIHAEATAAVVGGDIFVTSTSLEGTASTLMRGIPAVELLALAEACLQQLEAEAAETAPDGTNRYADFSERRSVWG